MDACRVLRPRDERGARSIPTTQACQPGPAIGHRAAAPLPEDSVDPEGSLQPPETVALRATGHRQGPLRARTPSARRRAIAGVARLGLTALPPTRRPSNRPRTVLESSSNRPRIVLEPSRQDQRRGLHHRGGMLRSAWAAPAAPGRQCWSSRLGSVGCSPGRAAGGQRRPGGRSPDRAVADDEALLGRLVADGLGEPGLAGPGPADEARVDFGSDQATGGELEARFLPDRRIKAPSNLTERLGLSPVRRFAPPRDQALRTLSSETRVSSGRRRPSPASSSCSRRIRG